MGFPFLLGVIWLRKSTSNQLSGYTFNGGRHVNLKSMSLDKLVALKNQVEAALSSKVAAERRVLQEGLSKLTRFQGGVRSKLGFGGGTRGSVAPKYRNPENPS